MHDKLWFGSNTQDFIFALKTKHFIGLRIKRDLHAACRPTEFNELRVWELKCFHYNHTQNVRCATRKLTNIVWLRLVNNCFSSYFFFFLFFSIVSLFSLRWPFFRDSKKMTMKRKIWTSFLISDFFRVSFECILRCQQKNKTKTKKMRERAGEGGGQRGSGNTEEWTHK